MASSTSAACSWSRDPNRNIFDTASANLRLCSSVLGWMICAHGVWGCVHACVCMCMCVQVCGVCGGGVTRYPTQWKDTQQYQTEDKSTVIVWPIPHSCEISLSIKQHPGKSPHQWSMTITKKLTYDSHVLCVNQQTLLKLKCGSFLEVDELTNACNDPPSPQHCLLLLAHKILQIQISFFDPS